MNAEEIRIFLYSFGFLSSLAFGARFLLQWYVSERRKESVVPKAFWQLSFTGNTLLFIHTFIQIQFPMCFLQPLHMVLAWRNLNLMGNNKKSLRAVFKLLFLAACLTPTLFIIQGFLFQPEYWWIRPTVFHAAGPAVIAPWWVHLIGILGVAAFSLRFWIQWWQAERSQQSVLPPIFWWMSLSGAILSTSYFIYIKDLVNLVGPSLALIPYIRNLQLIRHKNEKSQPKEIFCVITGEVSGDIIAAKIVNKLKKNHPDSLFVGVTGPELRQAGVETLFPMERLRVMGFTQVLWKLPTIFSCMKTVQRFLLSNSRIHNSITVLCVDSPSFSMKLAKKLKKKGFNGKIIQYVAPSVWAWGEHRVAELARSFDLLLTLYRFEPDYFKDSGLKTIWVGHSIAEEISPPTAARKKLIALFPGSRPFEIHNNLSIQLQALRCAFTSIDPYPIAISVAPGLSKAECDKMLQLAHEHGLEATLVPDSERYTLMQEATIALAKSGTVTLELALSHTPTIVTYHVSRLNLFFIKYFLKPKIRLFALPNIISGEQIFPEHIIPPISIPQIAEELVNLLQNKTAYQNIQMKLRAIKEAVTPTGSSIEVCTQAIEDELQ